MGINSKTVKLYRDAMQTIYRDYNQGSLLQKAYVMAAAQRALGWHDLPMMQQEAQRLLLLVKDWQGGAKVRNQLKRVTW